MRARIASALALLLFTLFVGAPAAVAAPHERGSRCATGSSTSATCRWPCAASCACPSASSAPAGSPRRRGGSLLVSAMNQSLGDGCRVSVAGDELVLHLDADKLPRTAP